MLNRLTAAIDFQSQALVLRSERQRVIASNIANADTPGYVSRDFNFAQALRNATSSNDGSGNTSLGSPISADVMSDAVGTRAAPALQYATPSQSSLDHNTVDMDRERAAFADNALKYESTLRFINGSVRTMLDAMKSPNQA